jgi:hypothetical protein
LADNLPAVAQSCIFTQIPVMRFGLPLLCLLLLTGACREKKKDLSGETPVSVTDFISVFPKITGNYYAADTNLARIGDTTQIGIKVLQQFFPDSILQTIQGRSKKIQIRAVGLLDKEKENYLLLRFSIPGKNSLLWVFVLDKKNKYLAAKELLRTDNEDGYLHSISINREPTFLLSRERTTHESNLQFSRTGWVYANEVGFMVVVNDSNEGAARNEIINPIDTLPRKLKYSGEYAQDKKNFISLRDGKKPNTYFFFIHFEKNEGACTGELKGELKMKTATTAEFTENGDPCVIDFRFEGNVITLKERGSCGNHRGIRCYFDDSFTRKREPRSSRKNK